MVVNGQAIVKFERFQRWVQYSDFVLSVIRSRCFSRKNSPCFRKKCCSAHSVAVIFTEIITKCTIFSTLSIMEDRLYHSLSNSVDLYGFLIYTTAVRTGRPRVSREDLVIERKNKQKYLILERLIIFHVDEKLKSLDEN